MKWMSDAAVDRLLKVADAPDLSATRYEIHEQIGRGGMGVVYRADDRELNRPVALKVLRDPGFDAGAVERMLREARIIAQLEHPGIVPIHDIGRLPDGRVFYVMKLVRGKRLDEQFAGDDQLADKLRVFERVCEAIAFAHAQGVIHRDLKPQNVMVGEFGEVLVLDWGVAKILRASDPPPPGAALAPVSADPRPNPNPRDSAGHAPTDGDSTKTRTHQTARGTVIGTPAYMSPEQARGDVEQVSSLSDVYSLGAILYFLLTGSPPKNADRASTTDSVAGQSAIVRPRRINPSVPRPLDAICLRALADSPSARYRNVSELTADLAAFRSRRPVAAYRESPVERLSRLARVYRTPILLVSAYLLMRIALILWQNR